MYGVIYRITNNKNGKTYIGLTTVSIQKRMLQHLYHARNRKCSGLRLSYLHRAILKYGIDSFSIECIASAISNDSLGLLERQIISQEVPEYNQTCGGEVTSKRKFTADVREKISAGNRGKKRTPEFRAKASETTKKLYQENPALKEELLGKLNRDRSSWEAKRIAAVKASLKSRKRTREEIEKGAAARRKRVFCVQNSRTYPSGKEASLDTGVSERSIRKVCTNQAESVMGYKFNYV